MPRRLLLPLLTVALLFAAAPVALAAAPAASPSPAAHVAIEDDDAFAEDDACADGSLAVADEDGQLLCDDEAWLDDELCSEDWADDEELLGEDDGEWSEEEVAEAGLAVASGDEDECAEEGDGTTAPPVLSALTARVSGSAGRAFVKIAFKLDTAGTVRLGLARVGDGGAQARRCAAAAAKRAKGAGDGERGAAEAKACRRRAAAARRAVHPQRGSLKLKGEAGANAIALRHWNGRALAAGSYRLTAKPAVRRGKAARTTFALKP